MTPRLTRPLAVAAALVSVGLLSACDGAQPGVAARVGEETVSVSEVNRLTIGFCEAARRDFQSQGNAFPMNVLASVVLQSLTMNAVVDQLAEEYGVEPSDAFAQSQADREQNFSSLDPDQAEAAVLVQGSTAYRDDILTEIGRQQLIEEGVSEPSVDDSLARGNEVLKEWLAENEPVIDPQYHLDLEDGLTGSVDTSTSYAASDAAVDAALADTFAERALEEDENQRFASYVRSLPASQRCG